MIAWLSSQAIAFASAVRRLARHPLTSLFEVLVLAIALALPVGLFVAVETLRGFASRHPTDPEISVFLHLGSRPDDIASVRQRLAGLSDIDSVRFIARQSAAAELRKSPAVGHVLDALPDNPLPDAFTVLARKADPARLDGLRSEIARWPQVALVQVDSDWARKVDAAVRVGRAAGLVLAALFGIAVLAVTFNTIRLQMLDRRQEIELARLFGATNGYIRRPFVYFGALQGFFGGALAIGLVSAGSLWLDRSLLEFSAAYGTHLTIAPVPAEHAGAFLGVATALGGLAAWIAASRYLWAHGLQGKGR